MKKEQEKESCEDVRIPFFSCRSLVFFSLVVERLYICGEKHKLQ